MRQVFRRAISVYIRLTELEKEAQTNQLISQSVYEHYFCLLSKHFFINFPSAGFVVRSEDITTFGTLYNSQYLFSL